MPSYQATLTSKGQLTLPAQVRILWHLRPGDQIEFFEDHLGGWKVRPLTAQPLDFLECLPPRRRLRGVSSDDEAVARAAVERNTPSSRRKRAG